MAVYCKMLTIKPLFRRLTKVRTVLLLAKIIGMLLLWSYYLQSIQFHKMNDRELLLPPNVPGLLGTTNSTEKIILYWTKFFNLDDFGVGTGRAPFISCRKTCFATNDRKLINKSDAIIFHVPSLDPKDLPPATWRLPHQLFVFYTIESPRILKWKRSTGTLGDMLRKHFMGYFNLTMTYRRDSDIVEIRYGRLKCINKSLNHRTDHLIFDNQAPCSVSSEESKVHWRNASKKRWNHKNKMIAWFVSHCTTDSKRELFVQDLKKFIEVDTYGKCPGSLKCLSKEETFEDTICDEMLEQYWFYLSFENSLCPDYVTEKLYRPLAYNSVPIVYGGADYTKFLPDGSYINLMNFNSSQQLADYLKNIIADDTLYSKFFEWKSFYELDDQTIRIGWSNLCELLHSTHQVKFYENVVDWYSGSSTNQMCISPPEHLIPA